MRTLHSTTRTLRRHALGVTLIELMVAVAIGAFLMIGAMNVFMQSRTTFRINQSVSRLQENARFILATIEPDIRMASYYGLASNGYQVTGRAKMGTPNGIGPNTCGNNWAIDLENPIVASNNAYGWPPCGANNAYQNGTDTLTIRRTVDNPTLGLLPANNLFVYGLRGAQATLFLPAAGAPPATVLPGGQSFQLIARGYYINSQSISLGAKGANIPSLRRKYLQPNVLNVADEEVLPGVEDLQVEFGIDQDAPGAAGRGSVDRYVNPGDPLLAGPNTAILAVRIWLRLRAEDIENGFTDTTNYVYADVNFTPNAAQAPFRRLLISKTIYLRNARPMA